MNLPKKPKREDYDPIYPVAFMAAERDYYKAVAEFAVGALETLIDNGAEYESEYDGRMYTCCIGCSYDDDKREHGKNCTYEAAFKALEAIRQTEQADQKPL